MDVVLKSNKQFVDNSFIRLLFFYLKQSAGENFTDIQIAFESLGLDPSRKDEKVYYTEESLIQLYNKLSATIDLADIPEIVFNEFEVPHIHHAGFALATIDDFSAFLEKAAEFIPIILPFIRCSTFIQGAKCQFSMFYPEKNEPNGSLTMDILLVIMIRLIKATFGNDIHYALQIPSSNSNREFKQVVDVPISFHSSKEYQIIFFSNGYTHTNIFGCELTSQFHALQLKNAKIENQQFIDKVKELVNGAIKGRYIAMSSISSQLGISTKTLQRQLKEVGIRFSDLVKLERVNQAKHMLSETNLSLKEIAFELGFSSPSSFSRAFKKDISLSPLQYRRRIRPNSDS